MAILSLTLKHQDLNNYKIVEFVLHIAVWNTEINVTLQETCSKQRTNNKTIKIKHYVHPVRKHWAIHRKEPHKTKQFNWASQPQETLWGAAVSRQGSQLVCLPLCASLLVEVRDYPERDICFLHVILQGPYQRGRNVGTSSPSPAPSSGNSDSQSMSSDTQSTAV